MKQKKTVIILAAVLVCVLIGFAIAQGDGKNQMKTYDKADTARMIDLGLDDTFAIVLDANPTTGFSWHCTIDNEDIISLQSEEFIEPQSKEPITGAPGKQYYEFTTTDKGTATIKFEYYQEWEKENIAESYDFTFKIN